MALTLADKITLARLGLMPLAVASYLYLPITHCLAFWFCGWICALAEFTDYVDGKVARSRGEVSDFGKLADPFCDVIYRIGMFLTFLLPIAGVGYPITFGNENELVVGTIGYVAHYAPFSDIHQSVYLINTDGEGQWGSGLVPWMPVALMVIRELIAGALRAMTASRGLVLAARTSGKIKAWFQGVTLITIMAFPAFWFRLEPWHLTYAFYATWACAILSIISIIEYIWVNRLILSRLSVHSQPTK
jgi:CDP-diacylglycerol---glycerol-3-phosphate 3-phosphatidyltransferase